ncbi:carbohydrate ABC transporter permease [Paenibacillus piri]|uniref:Carbohydrate ABC transporter permease n=2 Tax=Paenibacillus piri TaxID=2547395 RepID=A0A4R5KA76_9BACL|nr:carbohydrate ABC transporter permease [Paenibacillus piri]
MFGWIVNGVIALFALGCLIPFWMVVIGSLTSERSLKVNGFRLWPEEWSLNAYQYLFSSDQIFKSYGVTVSVTVVGTVLAVLITAMFSYVISHRKVKYRGVLSFMAYFTMLFGAGLVGFYILIAQWLDLKNTLWALILPYLLNPFFAFILVSFFRRIPYELNEAATVDGANDLYIFFRIICPISTPAIATISLFYALSFWNDWWLGLLFIDNHEMQPLQILIRQLQTATDLEMSLGGTLLNQTPPAYGVRYATVCVTIGPIVLLYPFIQRYFVKGLTIGAVKG